jgi:hypothetical protein
MLLAILLDYKLSAVLQLQPVKRFSNYSSFEIAHYLALHLSQFTLASERDSANSFKVLSVKRFARLALNTRRSYRPL